MLCCYNHQKVTKSGAINSDIANNDPQLRLVGDGYDHPFILNKDSEFAAKLVDLSSGRTLIVTTSEMAMVFYSGNFLSPGGKINQGHYARKHYGVCLETQNIPNAINMPGCVNNSLYTPENPYSSTTEWQFS